MICEKRAWPWPRPLPYNSTSVTFQFSVISRLRRSHAGGSISNGQIPFGRTYATLFSGQSSGSRRNRKTRSGRPSAPGWLRFEYARDRHRRPMLEYSSICGNRGCNGGGGDQKCLLPGTGGVQDENHLASRNAVPRCL